MDSSLASSSPLIRPLNKHMIHLAGRARAQSFRHEGRSASIVDANLSILRVRIEEVKIKERLEICYRSCKHGWCYAPARRNALLKNVTEPSLKYIEIVGFAGGTFGITCLSGTVFLYLVSLLVHLMSS